LTKLARRVGACPERSRGTPAAPKRGASPAANFTPSPSPAESPTRQSRFGDGAGRGGEAIEIIRPLVDLSRAEVRAFLKARGQAWREDETNEDPAFARNRLRREVLPLLREAANPKVDEALLRLADQASDAADVLQDAVESVWRQIVRTKKVSGTFLPEKVPDTFFVVDADDFALLRPWLQGAILRRAVERLGGGLKHMSAERTRAAVEALLSKSVAGPVALPGDLAATRRRRAIRIGKGNAERGPSTMLRPP